jgi:hypothetical protein
MMQCKGNCDQGRLDCEHPDMCVEYEGTYVDKLIGFALCLISALTVFSLLLYITWGL